MWSCQWWASLRTTTVKLMKYIFEESFKGIQVAIASPRSLPNAKLLKGRVVTPLDGRHHAAEYEPADGP